MFYNFLNVSCGCGALETLSEHQAYHSSFATAYKFSATDLFSVLVPHRHRPPIFRFEEFFPSGGGHLRSRGILLIYTCTLQRLPDSCPINITSWLSEARRNGSVDQFSFRLVRMPIN